MRTNRPYSQAAIKNNTEKKIVCTTFRGNFRLFTMIKIIHNQPNIDFLLDYVKKFTADFYNQILRR